MLVIKKLKSKKIILASNSPRRSQILKSIGINFKIIVSNFDEKSLDKSSFEFPYEFVKENSKQKALKVYESNLDCDLVIAADTIVVFVFNKKSKVINNKILEKPESKEEAFNMLSMLSGNKHEVFTGVTLIIKDKGLLFYCKKIVVSFYNRTLVEFDKITDENIKEYIETGEPM
jgi:septum formation protein